MEQDYKLKLLLITYRYAYCVDMVQLMQKLRRFKVLMMQFYHFQESESVMSSIFSQIKRPNKPKIFFSKTLSIQDQLNPLPYTKKSN